MNLKDLEKEKLRLEIVNSKKAWYKKPETWQGFLPTFLAIGSIVYAITSGIISVGLKDIENKKMEVILDTKLLEIKKEKLKVRDSILNEKLIVKKSELETAKKQIEIAIEQINILEPKSKSYDEIHKKSIVDVRKLDSLQNDFSARFENLKKEGEDPEKIKNDLDFKLKALYLNSDLQQFEISLGKVYYIIPKKKRIELDAWLSNKKTEYNSLLKKLGISSRRVEVRLTK